MTLPYRYAKAAVDDIAVAVSWYTERAPDIAAEFANRIDSAVREIAALPNAWSHWRGRADVRARSLAPRFPYSILYRVTPSTLFILAVAHHKRRPEYWLSRPR